MDNIVLLVKSDSTVEFLGGNGSKMALVQAQDPVVTTSAITGPTIGTTSTQVLAANSNRIQAILTNDSDEVIYVAKGVAAQLNKGIRLNAQGGSITITNFKGAINAICTSGNKKLCVAEES